MQRRGSSGEQSLDSNSARRTAVSEIKHGGILLEIVSDAKSVVAGVKSASSGDRCQK